MSNRTRRLAVVLGAAALTVPTAAVAAPGKGPDKPDAPVKAQSGGKGDRAKAKAKGKAKAKRVKLTTYVVKGVYDGAGVVDVTGGNSHTRRAGLIRDDVAFDFRSAKLVVADTDGDDAITVADLQVGDKLTIQLKLPRSLGDGPYAARKVVDRTHPPVDTDDAEDETDVPAGEPAATDA